MRAIDVLPHDPTRVEAFEREAEALRGVFGDRALAMHHVGSTAVPGLAAKPTVDILVVLDRTDDIEKFSPDMIALGYRVRGESLDAPVPGTPSSGIPGHFYFSKDVQRGAFRARTHHVHVCAPGHPQIDEMLVFRDYLRAHPAEAAMYGAVKQRAAQQHRFSSDDYVRAKDAEVRRLLTAAIVWHRSNVASM